MKENYKWKYQPYQGTLTKEERIVGSVTLIPIQPKALEIKHTYVDPTLRGQGIGKQLLVSLLEEESLKEMLFQPTCSYAVTFFEKHPEYQKRLYKGEE
ncbi:MAG TPA: N-acetyltransferase [Candidatus Pelethosoma merdigallinarum]|nr:N-acetyltransferase [Candidatus Pelethosoma merdigallinarum]